MRKVFLDDLPRWREGRHRGKIDWNSSIGHRAGFIYDEIEGQVLICKHVNGKLTIAYGEITKDILVCHFRNCKLGEMLTRHHIYKPGDIMDDVRSGKLQILKQTKNDKYIKNNKYYEKSYTYKCLLCGNIDSITETNLRSKNGCRVCAGQKVLKGYNDLWTTHPHIAELLSNKEDGYKYSKGSNVITNFICRDCGEILSNTINNIVNTRTSCPQCSDGFSYPEKIMYNVLNQANIEFDYQKIFEWSNNKRYDFYIPELELIIETHGLQHYEESNRGRTLQEETENDQYKNALAKRNGINKYITIDCRFSKLNHIKNNIINSELKNIFNMECIDWAVCDNYANYSLVRRSCELWNEEKGVKEISKQMKINSETVVNYLKKGVENKWCDYKFEEKNRAIIMLSLSGEYIQRFAKISDASKKMRVSISAIYQWRWRGRGGGYRWMYEEEYDKVKDNIIPYKTKHRTRSVVRIDINGDYIDEWRGAADASLELKINPNNITNACRGRSKTAGGYKWMYKEDYEKYIANVSNE